MRFTNMESGTGRPGFISLASRTPLIRGQSSASSFSSVKWGHKNTLATVLGLLSGSVRWGQGSVGGSLVSTPS